MRAGYVLVTGGAGFIGSHLVRWLVAEGSAEVVVLDSLRRGRIENLESCRNRIEFVRGDVQDRELVRQLAEGVELIYHLAAESRVLDAEEDLERTFKTNVQGTFNVLSAALEAGVRRVIFTSSREVYGDPKALPVSEDAPLAPKNAYGVSKAAAELWCRAFQSRGLDVVILRLANVYGFGDRALSGRPLLVYGGSQVLDFVWVGDVVDVLFRAGDMRGRYDGLPINVGSGCGTGLAVLAERVRELVGQRIEVVVEPSRPVEVERFVADVSRLRALFGLPRSGDPLTHLPELIEHA
jgi:UDP-glucose 4-epimerase